MLTVFETKSYRKSIKKYSKSFDFDIKKVEAVIKIIQNEEALDRKYKSHGLKGNFQGIEECHVESDLLLLYQIYEGSKTLFLINIGSHSELFK